MQKPANPRIYMGRPGYEFQGYLTSPTYPMTSDLCDPRSASRKPPFMTFKAKATFMTFKYIESKTRTRAGLTNSNQGPKSITRYEMSSEIYFNEIRLCQILADLGYLVSFKQMYSRQRYFRQV